MKVKGFKGVDLQDLMVERLYAQLEEQGWVSSLFNMNREESETGWWNREARVSVQRKHLISRDVRW